MIPRSAALRVAIVAVIALLVLVAASVRLVDVGRAELAASDAAWTKGDAIGAAVHARAAARASVPGTSHATRGYQRLRGIAETSERNGDIDAALFAWRAALSASVASRPFASDCAEVCGEAATAVTRVSNVAQASRPAATRRNASLEAPSAATNVVPVAAWGVLIVGGVALLWGAGLRLSRVLAASARPAPAQLRVVAGMALVGLVAWLAGLFLG